MVQIQARSGDWLKGLLVSMACSMACTCLMLESEEQKTLKPGGSRWNGKRLQPGRIAAFFSVRGCSAGAPSLQVLLAAEPVYVNTCA
jgi:hypothetical protein